MAIYGLRPADGRPWRLATPLGLGLLGLYVMLVAGNGVTPHYVEGFYAVLPLGFAILLLLSRGDRLPSGLATLDRKLGDVAYGVFLCHFVAAFVLLAAQERIHAETGVFNLFGRYNQYAFGAWT